MHFAWFIWHFSPLGLHKWDNYVEEIRSQTFFDFSEFTPYYFEVGQLSCVGALEIFLTHSVSLAVSLSIASASNAGVFGVY